MATKNDIITLPNDHLRARSRKVKVITDDTRQLIIDMKTATLDWEASRPHELGVALAAVQIDALERVVVIRNDFDNKEDETFITLINPEVIRLEGEPELDHEGCLSVKDVYAMVPRYPKVRVRALDENGRELRVKAEGFLARVLQHEIDHINGIVFVDRVNDTNGFFKLNIEGKLEPVSYDEIQKSGVLADEK